MKVGLVLSSLLWLGIGYALSGCSLGQQGHVVLAADAQGMRAFADALNGMIAQGKARPGATGAYFAHRNIREGEETRRAIAPGFLAGLFRRANNEEVIK